MTSKTKRGMFVALSAGAVLAVSACSGGATPAPGGSTAGGGTGGGATDCAAYESYGDLSGKTITVYTSIASDAEAKPHIDAFIPFEECTGAKVEYEGSREFEAQLPVRVKAGNAPDLAYIPQPGLLQTLVKENADKVVPVGEAATANVDKYYKEFWKNVGMVDGEYYGIPIGANAKSFVWYSPKTFAEKGYEIPKTWDELMALTDKITADIPADDTTSKAWCAGIESGGATGWPATDWVEDMMLRVGTPEQYDQWVNHEIPFNDPVVIEAIDKAGSILKNEQYVNGGLGGVTTIATTPFTDAGFPILDGMCFMHRQASFYQANWQTADPDAEVSENGDVWAFPLPGESATPPVLVGGEFALAFRDAPEVAALQAYLTSPEWSNAKADATPNGGWLSANSELDPNKLVKPIDKMSYELITADDAVVRFDGSDLMPSAVGAGSFWKEMTDWIALGKSSQDAATAIEASWPKQ